MANVIDNFRRCADICEKSGWIMVMEPLNNRRDHPRALLTKIAQAFAICRCEQPRSQNSSICIISRLPRDIIPNIDLACS
jgi:hydroxypyruvate isomerase